MNEELVSSKLRVGAAVVAMIDRLWLCRIEFGALVSHLKRSSVLYGSMDHR